jgi:hypothetical protein
VIQYSLDGAPFSTPPVVSCTSPASHIIYPWLKVPWAGGAAPPWHRSAAPWCRVGAATQAGMGQGGKSAVQHIITALTSTCHETAPNSTRHQTGSAPSLQSSICGNMATQLNMREHQVLLALPCGARGCLVVKASGRGASSWGTLTIKLHQLIQDNANSSSQAGNEHAMLHHTARRPCQPTTPHVAVTHARCGAHAPPPRGQARRAKCSEE